VRCGRIPRSRSFLVPVEAMAGVALLESAALEPGRSAQTLGLLFAITGGMEQQRRRRWQIKDTIVSPWQDLPGLYTPLEIDGMRRLGCFVEAKPVDVAQRRVPERAH